MWPTTAAAPVTAASAAPPDITYAIATAAIPFADVERHDDHAAPGAGRAQDVRGPDVAASGEPDVDPRPPREEEREWDGSGQVSEQDREHQLNGTRSSGS